MAWEPTWERAGQHLTERHLLDRQGRIEEALERLRTLACQPRIPGDEIRWKLSAELAIEEAEALRDELDELDWELGRRELQRGQHLLSA